MLLRKVLFVTAALAVVVGTPADLTAQERGLDRATTASAGAEANGQKANSGKVDRALPRGIAKRFVDETLPPGIRRTRGDSEPVDVEPDPEVEEPDPNLEENCTITELEGLPPVIECASTP